MPPRVLLVGAGITSSLASNFMKKNAKESLYLEVWDKAKGVGGRMSTSRSPKCNSSKGDLGAQYITTSPEEFLKYQDVYESLISQDLLQPLTANIEGMKSFPHDTKHFVAPNGMNSIVHHFLQCDSLKFEHHITTVSKQDSQVLVETKEKVREVFDAVILTMPVPQILEIIGGMLLSTELYGALQSVRYSSRYALGLFYDSSNNALNVPWDAKYIYDDDIFRFVSLDNRKRKCNSESDVCVFHTSTQYGSEHIESSIDNIKKDLLVHVRQMFPSWPEPIDVKCQKWRYSQVVEPYMNKPGYVVLMSSPLIIAGGDGFRESNFNGCLYSATKLAEVALKIMNLE